jgi:hypothetical protein
VSIIATAVKHLIAAGVTGDALVQAIAEMEAAQPVKVDAVAERRRAYDRQRKAKAEGNSGGIPPESADTPLNDIYSNPPGGAKAPSLADRVVEAWNSGPGAKGATKARPLDANRRKALSVRLKEHDENEVFEAIRNLAASDWHCGKNPNGWTANLGWLLKSPENFQKSLEMGANVRRIEPPPKAVQTMAQIILERQAAGAAQ